MVAFWMFLEVCKVVKCNNWASNDAVASLLYADMFELYLVVRFLYICDESSSLLASRLRSLDPTQ